MKTLSSFSKKPFNWFDLIVCFVCLSICTWRVFYDELINLGLIFLIKFSYIDILVLCDRQDILNQYSMVNLELFNIMEEVNKVSKAFVVYPKNVNAENAASMNFSSSILLWHNSLIMEYSVISILKLFALENFTLFLQW